MLVGGRSSNGAASAAIDEFTPATSSLRPVARLPQPVADSAVITMGSTAYVIGGETSKPTATVQTIAARRVLDQPLTPSAGGLVEFNRAGRILWRYAPRHGPGMLNHPSLGEVLPDGFIRTNDDDRNRVVIVDPHTTATHPFTG